MDPQRALPFDPLLDYAREPYLRSISGRRDALGRTPSQQAMTLPTSLSSGQGFYTVESLEGATSLPLPKTAPPVSLPRPETHPASLALTAEREALLRLDARTKALLADRESLDARARLLAVEKEVLLRALPGEARVLSNNGLPPLEARPRDGLQSLDARARALSDGLQPPARVVDSLPRHLPDSLQPLDARGRASSDVLNARSRALFDSRLPRDALANGLDGRSRVPPLIGDLALRGQERLPLPELLPPRDLRREGLPHFLPADPRARAPLPRQESLDLRGRRENPELRRRTESLELHGRGRDWVLDNGKRVAERRRPEPVENFRVRKQVEKVKPLPSSNPSLRAGLGQKPPAGKTKPPSVESEGWCAVCKIDCFYSKTLAIHLAGKKHKSVLEKLKEEGKIVSASEHAAKQEAKAVSSKKGTTNTAERKRENDDKVEASRSAKRLKASASADAITVTVAAAADAQKGNDNEAHPVCKICNISCTGKKNLYSHLKGKKHAARLLELREA